jgi:KaiC/GvpD/RAD55 family RecA-like ATPase
MTKIQFMPAVRRQTKARIALSGPPGSGKTYTALGFAHVLAPGSVAVIDTEKESADGYEGLNGWHWGSFKPASYEPEVLIDALAEAAANGFGCVVIDSLSHFWMGTGGMLEQVDNSTKRSRASSSFSSGWKEMRPVERRMIDAITGYPGHVIVTMRTKTEWVVQENERGKSAPRKVGTKPEQREGIEYEFSVVAEMDVDNVLTVSKTRVPPLKRGVFAEPGPEVAQKILDWLNEGEESLPSVTNYRDRAVAKHATREDLLALLEEVEGRNLASASVVDDEGETVALKELIVRKGRALAPAAVPPTGGEQQRERNPAGARPSAAGGWRAALTAEELEALGDWEDAIDAITAPEDREVLDADLDGAGDQMSMIRGTAIRKAIDAKVAEVTPRAAAA